MCLLLLVTGTVVMMIVMAITGAPLKTPTTSKGIIDLEFAYNESIANRVLSAWQSNGITDNIFAAKINTWLDFIFLFFYSLLLWYTCILIAPLLNGFLSKAGRFFAGMALAAGMLDIFENAGMLLTLNGNLSMLTTMLTAIFSSLKWLIVLVVLLYILAGGCQIAYRKMIGKTN